MKSTVARAATVAFGFWLLTVFRAPAFSEEFYFYRAPDGRLVLSNQKPPSGSTILKQRTYVDPGDSQKPQAEKQREAPSDGNPDGSAEKK